MDIQILTWINDNLHGVPFINYIFKLLMKRKLKLFCGKTRHLNIIFWFIVILLTNKKSQRTENSALWDDKQYYRGATQLDLYIISPLISRTIIRSAFLRVQFPSIATCEISLSFALRSPFGLILNVAITPSATLWR